MDVAAAVDVSVNADGVDAGAGPDVDAVVARVCDVEGEGMSDIGAAPVLVDAADVDVDADGGTRSMTSKPGMA